MTNSTVAKMIILSFSFLLAATQANAKVFAKFHPYDSTLTKMAQLIQEAESTVDIAAYNIDSNQRNPIIAAIASEAVQSKLSSGRLSIRLIFEGYEAPEKVEQKMLALEELGIDVRHLRSGRKMHHKFIIIDHNSPNTQLVTGSANFSMMSQAKFSESLLFFESEPGMSDLFQEQFNLLWDNSTEVGHAIEHTIREPKGLQPEPGFDVFFNSENFVIENGKVRKDSKAEGFHLTRQIVELIDSAEETIEIASTRIKLRPIHNAIVRAAERGVKVHIVVTMGEYEYKSRRRKLKIADCENEYNKTCSTSQNFSIYLSRENFEGSKNVDVRLKYFNIRKAAYLGQQMHSKYIIVDGEHLLTGSFNWSYSAEYNHIENLVYVDGQVHPQILKDYRSDFQHLWRMNRENYDSFIDEVESAVSNRSKINCGFKPMALSYSEIDHMLNSGRRVGGSLKGICK